MASGVSLDEQNIIPLPAREGAAPRRSGVDRRTFYRDLAALLLLLAISVICTVLWVLHAIDPKTWQGPATRPMDTSRPHVSNLPSGQNDYSTHSSRRKNRARAFESRGSNGQFTSIVMCLALK